MSPLADVSPMGQRLAAGHQQPGQPVGSDVVAQVTALHGRLEDLLEPEGDLGPSKGERQSTMRIGTACVPGLEDGGRQRRVRLPGPGQLLDGRGEGQDGIGDPCRDRRQLTGEVQQLLISGRGGRDADGGN